MPNVLIFNYYIPYPPHYNGNTLRVFPLSCELSRKHRCFLAAFGKEDERLYNLKKTGVYDDILLLPTRDGNGLPYRHLFLRTGNLARVAQPQYYRQIVKSLEKFIHQNKIDLIITHGPYLSQYIELFAGVPKILDSIDCITLALKREQAYQKISTGWHSRLTHKLQMIRALYQESRATNVFSLVTTVSPVDRDTLREMNKNGQDRILDIPNGVSVELVDYEFSGDEMHDSIAFWGTLDFPPNSAAIYYFYNEVFLKYLKDKKITWHIIGKNPEDKMIEMGKRHKYIVVTGFVDDLYGMVSRIPVMINPMRIGGGLKNKVLEAFALERVVISNQLGMEAINAQKGIHYIHAEKPQEFAEEILKYAGSIELGAEIGCEARRFVLENYTWEKIGKRYLELIDVAFQLTKYM